MSGEHIGEYLAKIEKNIELNTSDPILREGFTQVPNHILRNQNISQGAKNVYSLFLSYAWHDDFCFPGQEKLAEHCGSSKRSVVTWLQELQDKGLVEVTRRGLGKTNLYKLNFVVKDTKNKIRR